MQIYLQKNYNKNALFLVDKIMIGTFNEIAYYISFDNTIRRHVGASPKYFSRLRRLKLSEEDVKEVLIQAGCVMVRPSFLMPAMYIDKYGRMYSEQMMLLKNKEWCRKNGISIEKVDEGKLPPESKVALLASKKEYKLVSARMTLPSVWSYEPVVPDWLPEDTKAISRIIGSPLFQSEE